MVHGRLFILCWTLGLMAPLWMCIPGHAAEALYVGVDKCRGCHLNAYRAWKKGGHSKALVSLKGESRKDPRCLTCHTTGYGKPSSATARLENVQCESCHGPGSLYRGPQIMDKRRYLRDPRGMHRKALEAGMIEPREGVCRTCHNEGCSNFKGFDFRAALKKIKHRKS